MISLTRNGVSGQYRGTRQDFQLILRVDVGLQESLDIISGDLLTEQASGEFEFHHSFQTTSLILENLDDGEMLRGAVKVHNKDMLDIARLDLSIPDEGELVATYTFYRLTSLGRQTALTLSFPLTRETDFFRQVELEVDRVEGVPLPDAFQTNDHPDTPTSVPPRALNFQAAYRDAGIDMVTTFDPTTVPTSDAGPDQAWTDEELHDAMVSHFSDYADRQQWRLYLLLATEYVDSGVLGIMFDSGDDFPRQGAAVFYDHPAIKNAPEIERNREYLYTIVHELGHAFNYLHAFQKGIFDTHGILPRPASLSWMNYPQLFPFGYAFPPGWDGSGSFWSQFEFGFDRDELSHIRHSDSAEVIMGGRNFGFAGHLDERPFERPTSGQPVSVTLWTPPVIEFMQQLEGDIRIRNDIDRPVSIHSHLHPSGENITLLIRRPSDRFPKVYRHFYHTCSKSLLRELPPGQAVYQEITPSFGLRHWFLDEPGSYELQAIYHSPEGQRHTSEIRRVRVIHPSPEADRLASDFFSIETGTYFGVEGSRSQALDKVRDLLTEVSGRLPKSAITHQINVVNALCGSRVFKDVKHRKAVIPDRSKGVAQLCKALGVNLTKQTIQSKEDQSNVRVTRILRSAVKSLVTEEESDKAGKICGAMKKMLTAVKAPDYVKKELNAFQKQAGL